VLRFLARKPFGRRLLIRPRNKLEDMYKDVIEIISSENEIYIELVRYNVQFWTLCNF
jgi:hypothetical protein